MYAQKVRTNIKRRDVPIVPQWCGVQCSDTVESSGAKWSGVHCSDIVECVK